MTTPEHTIVSLCQRSHQISKDKGWVKDGDPRPFHTTIALMHSELSEALEEYREHRKLDEVYYTVTYTTDDGAVSGKHKEVMSCEKLAEFRENEGSSYRVDDAKPEGIPIELADLVIRICQRVGTDGDATQLDLFCSDQAPGDLDTDFELFATERHADLSAAYRAHSSSLPSTGLSRNQNALRSLARCLNATFSFCAFHNIDLWAAIDEKEAYNKTRPERHGGKKI
jgi:hypothetical protein